MSLAAYSAILFVGLAVVFSLIVVVAALTGWWIEVVEEDRARECQMGKGGR